MSLNLLLRARSFSNLLNHLPKRIHLRSNHSISASSYNSSTYHCSCSSSLLVPSNKILNTVNYATSTSTSTTTTTTTTASTDTNWITIYRLPLIRLAAGFQRLKFYQGLLSAIALSGTFGMSQLGSLSSEAVMAVAAIGGTGLITLSICSLFVRNTVGFIYVDEECEKMKVAYVDYWGKRRELIIDIDDLDVEYAKGRPTVGKLYRTIRLYSDKKQSFKLLSNYGIVVEPETFDGIFGAN